MAGSEPPTEQRSSERVDATWAVDCETEDTFLFASITNVSQMGIFVRTDQPLQVGTVVKLSFAPERSEGMADPAFTMLGRVQWINRVSAFGDNINPGMGIMFVDMGRDDRERLVAAIRTIAYLRGDPPSN